MRMPVFLALVLAALLNAQTPAIQLIDNTHSKTRESQIRAHMAFLSDDLLEGRGTDSRGGNIAVRYLESQLQAYGILPGNGNSYLQPIHLLSMAVQPTTSLGIFQEKGDQKKATITKGNHLIAFQGEEKTHLDAPLVFVGLGINAPGFEQLKDVDLSGKIMVCLVDDHPDIAKGCCSRWHYANQHNSRILNATRRKAAGVMFVIKGAFLKNKKWKRVMLDTSEPIIPGMGLSLSKFRHLLKSMGKNPDSVIKASMKKDFQHFAMPWKLKGAVHSVHHNLVQQNVVGLLPGTDPTLKKELLIYSAHWDHLGKDQRTGRIYPGAVDNASACAALLAIAKEAVQHPTRRSQLFLFPCAEEFLMQGSTGYVRSPLWPLEKTIANLNLESLNVWGPTRDIGLMGSETSTLHAISIKVAHSLGLKATPFRPDPTSLYFRSDHFPFAQAGIPAFSPGFSLNGGWDYLDPKQGKAATKFESHHYHKTSDRYHPEWDLRGLLQQTAFIEALGRELANADERPQWLEPKPDFR